MISIRARFVLTIVMVCTLHAWAQQTVKAPRYEGTSATGPNFSSDATSGPPFQVNSTAQVNNLNADLLNGFHANAFARLSVSNTFSANQIFGGNISVNGDSSATGNVTGSNLRTTPDTTGVGIQALFTNTSGVRNTAAGGAALYCNGNYTGTCSTSGSGSQNTAVGFSALHRGNGLTSNTGIGDSSLGNLVSGNANVAVGDAAGLNLQSGSSNIYIGNSGQSNESSVTRLGTSQTQTFIAGINGALVTGTQVVIDANGQLGTVVSSRRFKEQIANMDQASAAILQLRPVTFRYRAHPQALQYGLIAEEVAEVYPDLVQYSNSGEPISVLYHLLTPMLLNEVQRLHQQVASQQAQISAQQSFMKEIMRKQEQMVGDIESLREKRVTESPVRTR